jgi:predicted acetyltransferase
MPRLVRPTLALLPHYVAALQRGWSADGRREAVVALQELDAIAGDAERFVAGRWNPLGGGDPVTLPDGSQVPRLPNVQHWIWDGDDERAAGDGADGPFCGLINLRWVAGGGPLPPYVLGHIGYSVVPWQRRRGLATWALGQVLPLARAQGLAAVELTTDPDNLGSQRVIEANGGVLVERFAKPAAHGGGPGLRYRIGLG